MRIIRKVLGAALGCYGLGSAIEVPTGVLEEPLSTYSPLSGVRRDLHIYTSILL